LIASRVSSSNASRGPTSRESSWPSVHTQNAVRSANAQAMPGEHVLGLLHIRAERCLVSRRARTQNCLDRFDFNWQARNSTRRFKFFNFENNTSLLYSRFVFGRMCADLCKHRLRVRSVLRRPFTKAGLATREEVKAYIL